MMRRRKEKRGTGILIILLVLFIGGIKLAGEMYQKDIKAEDILLVIQEKIGNDEITNNIETEKNSSNEAVIEEKKAQKTGQQEERQEDGYAYSYLSQEEKTVYGELLDMFMKHEAEVEVSTLEPDTIERAYRYLVSDYPGLFWVSGYSYVQHKLWNETTKIVIDPEYTMTQEERQEKQGLIDAKAEEYLRGISSEASDYEKMKYIYDCLTTNVIYNQNAPDNQNICSVFLTGETVCQGYAYATQYLLQKLNIPCVTVTGTALGEGHAWNLVQLDGDYYYVDTTWGSNSNQEEYANQINYAYFCITTEEMKLTHQPSDLFPLPECTATQNNYFMKEGHYFDTYDTAVFDQFLKQSYEQQQTNVCLKFADKELYDSFRNYYIGESHIFDCVGNTTSIHYLEDEVHNVLTFYFQM